MQLQRLNSNDIEMWSFPMADGEYGASGGIGENGWLCGRRQQHFGVLQQRRLRTRSHARECSRRANHQA
jgi:hypothetical protein